MLPIKKILWPSDFSGPSYDALKAAKELAEHFSAQLHFLHVVPPMPPYVPPPKGKPSFNLAGYIKDLQLSAEKSLQEVKEKKVRKNIKTHISVLQGDVAEKIVFYARKKSIDVIVISSQGTSGGNEAFLGSVTEKLVRISPFPTLVFRSPSESHRKK
jgi:nucleotide-binding universal stress UspA family protein